MPDLTTELMSFQSKGFSTSKDAGCLTDGDVTYGNASRIEPKRPHQWFIDGGEAEIFPNKKQAIEVPSSSSFAEMQASTVSPWGNVSGFHSVPSQLDERLFNTEATRSINFHHRNIPSVSAGNLNIGRRLVDESFGNNSQFGLSIAHSMDDPKLGINYGGVRKVKVSEVRDSENVMPTSIGPSYSREDNSVISTAHGYDKSDDSGISMGLTYGGEEEHAIAIGESYGREEDNLIPVGQPFNKGDANITPMGHNYKTPRNTLTMEPSFGEGSGNIMSMVENFNKRDDVIPMGILSKGDDINSLTQTYKDVHCSIPLSSNYGKRDDSMLTMAQSTYKGESHSLSMGHSFDKGGGNIISFGGFGDDDANASGRLICSYDLLMNPSSDPRSDTLNNKNLAVSDAYALINTGGVSVSGAQSTSKKKEDQKSAKKIAPNNFPSNVRSLLSTGILDEVSVKYAAWSREKELRGIIKGSGYLCGCQSCNFSKVINAYEFERHAGCKTKHPNNHIYFENGKTIYGIVQELRSTPQNMLFDVIQTITGSPINQKYFRIWKESFLAATRELQRIYGKDDRNQPL